MGLDDVGVDVPHDLATLKTWLAGPTLAPSWLPLAGPPCNETFCWEPSRVILASAVFHTLQFVLLACFCSLFAAFRRMPWADRINWLSYTVSTTHSAIASAGAVYSLFVLNCYHTSVCSTRCHTAELSVAFSIGYFFYDYLCMFAFPRVLYSHVYLVHHFLGAGIGSLTFVIPSCQYVASLFLLSESSTPFVNMRWFLEKIGLRNHPVYLLNGVLMTAAFFVARIALTTYFLVEVFVLYPEEYATLPPVWVGGLSTSVLILTYINTTWFLKMFRGLLRALGGTQRAAVKTPPPVALSPRPRLKAE